MSVKYAAVKWNRNKRIYDGVIALCVAAYISIFFLAGKLIWRGAQGLSDEVLLIRALGTCAFVMLNFLLCVGPLARLDRRWLPVLYNRRHLGVTIFLLGLAHGLLSLGYYHGFGVLNPVVSLLTSNTNYASLRAFPFEILGLTALLILFCLAATSHDFWQKNLGPSVWKGLHMLVYPAYALLVMHVALGALQAERSPIYAALVVAAAGVVAGLHLTVGLREMRRDRAPPAEAAGPADAAWIDVGCVDEIADCRAKVVCLPGRERVAVFRYGNRVSAVTNVCAHQRGPLGEGKIVDGCITCPWHGWDYRPENGQSPPPFNERIATYRVRVERRRILLNPESLPAGTPVEPATFAELADA